MNKFCFGVTYNGRLWEKELRVSAQFKVKIVKKIREINYNFMAKNRDQFSFSISVSLLR